MDIRIGNDIKLNFDLSKVKIYDPTNIESIQCLFVKDHCCNKDSDFPHICPTEYTIHSCGVPVYNVDVNNHNNHHCHHDSCFCGFSVKNGWNSDDVFSTTKYEVTERGEKNLISVWFNAANQKCGTYRIVLAVTVKTSDTDKQYHSYRLDYGYIFAITDDPNAKEGDIEIDMFNQSVADVAHIIDIADYVNTEDTFSADSIFLYKGYNTRCEIFEDNNEIVQDNPKNYLIIRPSCDEDFDNEYYVFEECGQNESNVVVYKYYDQYTEDNAPYFIKLSFGTTISDKYRAGLMSPEQFTKLSNTASLNDIKDKPDVVEITGYLNPNKKLVAGSTFTIYGTPVTEIAYVIKDGDYQLIFRYNAAIPFEYFVFREDETVGDKYTYKYETRYTDKNVPSYIQDAFYSKIDTATSDKAGLMSAKDKIKLDLIGMSEGLIRAKGLKVRDVRGSFDLGHLDSTADGDIELATSDGGDINIESIMGAIHAKARDTILLNQYDVKKDHISLSELKLDGDIHMTAGSGEIKIEADDKITILSYTGAGDKQNGSIKLRVDDGLSATLDKNNDRFNVVSKEIRWVEKTKDGDKEHLLSEELNTLSDLKQNAITRIDVEHTNSSVILHAVQNGYDDEIEIDRATQQNAGMMSASDKLKLDSINIQNKILFLSSSESWDEICSEAEVAIRNNNGYPVSLLMVEDNVSNSDTTGSIQYGSAAITEEEYMLIYMFGYYKRQRILFTKVNDEWVVSSQEIKQF